MQERHLSQFSDSDLLSAIQNGDKTAYNRIVEKYTPLVVFNSKHYYIPGGEFQDIVQEGMIGLLKAVQTYNSASGKSFYQFANLCILSSLKSAVKASLRKKHIPLNTYVSFGNTDSQQNRTHDPVDLLIDKELISEIQGYISQHLTDYEKKVFEQYVNGSSFGDIASKLHVSRKSVDNAVYRIKAKLKTGLS